MSKNMSINLFIAQFNFLTVDFWKFVDGHLNKLTYGIVIFSAKSDPRNHKGAYSKVINPIKCQSNHGL